jgi:hypothetical protein
MMIPLVRRDLRQWLAQTAFLAKHPNAIHHGKSLCAAVGFTFIEVPPGSMPRQFVPCSILNRRDTSVKEMLAGFSRYELDGTMLLTDFGFMRVNHQAAGLRHTRCRIP